VPGAHEVRAQVRAAADQVTQLLVSSLGIQTGRRSPAANRRARRIASRLSVLIRSPGRRSMFAGEQTAISIPSGRARRTSP
jgi:hypothetical protein